MKKIEAEISILRRLPALAELDMELCFLQIFANLLKITATYTYISISFIFLPSHNLNASSTSIKGAAPLKGLLLVSVKRKERI